jgi:putative Holliday junction resolvase
MRILSLDVGDKRIGIAISDELELTARGIGVIERKGLKEDIKEILNILEQFDIGRVVIGLPRNMNGTLGPQGESVKNFGEKLKSHANIDIVYWDERLTTIAAERTLLEADLSRKKRKGLIDKMAAVLILQNYLDYKYKSHVDTK